MRNYIARDRRKGRGVFAGRDYEEGDLVEVCELILVDADSLGDGLEGYVYEYDQRRVAVALGYGSLYNHSDHCNVEYFFDKKKKHLHLVASRSVVAGDELTIDYGYSEADRKRFRLC